MDGTIPKPATTPLPSYKGLTLTAATDDSGYYTSFTPGSIDSSRSSNATPSLFSPKIHVTYTISTRPIQAVNYSDLHRETTHNNVDELTPQRRGVKRPYEENSDSANTSLDSLFSTPTSVIAGEIQNLVFDDNKQNCSKNSSSHSQSIHQSTFNEHIPIVSYPTTPVKKHCKSSCKLSPFNQRNFMRKEEFATHSLSCERKALQPVKHRLEFYKDQAGLSKVSKIKPNQKFDIIKTLFKKSQGPPLAKILNYLSNEDIYNFLLVSPTWSHIWESIVWDRKKQEFLKYKEEISSNVENWENGVVPQLPYDQTRTLREIHNELMRTPSSPPGSPKTNRFKKFTREASVDTRAQLACMQCQYPAKVTKEVSGEMWAKCTNVTCAYQFCKLCKGNRHPGSTCLQYGLNELSPPKRKKNFYAINSKKSKKNLCRLLC